MGTCLNLLDHKSNSFTEDIYYDNNVNIKIEGNLILDVNGEIAFITHGEKICFDSINSQIYLNSRMSKPIKDLPESIKYRNLKKDNCNSNTFEDIYTLLLNKIKLLELRVNELENKLKDNVCQE